MADPNSLDLPNQLPDPVFRALHYLPDSMAQLIGYVPQGLWEKEDYELLKEPSTRDYALRQRLWENLDRLMHSPPGVGATVHLGQCLEGICSRQTFGLKIKRSNDYLAWLMCRPQNFESTAKANLEFAQGRIQEILELDIKYVDKEGNTRLDTKAAKLIWEIYQGLGKRVFGDYVQRSIQKTEVTTVGGQAQAKLPTSVAEAEAMLAAIRGELPAPLPKDV